MFESLHNKPHLKYFRKKLRNSSTKAEVYLWEFLKESKLEGVKFRRQHSIGSYIVDFYCYQYSLVVELDGESHDNEEMIKHDIRKNSFLVQNGQRVLRFKNEEIFENIEGVLNIIKEQFTTPAPSLEEGN